jgi:nucleoside recognition membrane protein YjiH
MVHQLNQSSVATIQLTWQSILWRLLLTALLLLILAGSSVTIFNTVITHPGTRVLPTLTQGTGAGDQGSGTGQPSFPGP